MPLSGPQWVAQFPTSRSLDDLVEPFQTNARRFVSALTAANATVTISASFRPPQRAYLMHYSFQIAKTLIDPTAVPLIDGVDIQWAHTAGDGSVDEQASHQAATAMVQGYGIVFSPALTSLHSDGLAVDMNISWNGNLVIVDANGATAPIASLPRSCANRQLQQIGATYGVIKLATDPPHWSLTGH